MIRWLVKLGTYLDKRFPEKRVVTASDYDEMVTKISALDAELSLIREDANEAKTGVEVLVSRMGTLETKAAHVDALRACLVEVKKLQDEYASLKTSLGLNRPAQPSPDAVAFLNGLPTGVSDEQF